MQPDEHDISVTVKVPFVGDRILTANPQHTVRDLIDNVLTTCQTSSPPNTPHCIVQSGRILPETHTLQQAAVSDGAVLHLMPRPRDSNRIPGRSTSSRTRSNRPDTNETPNSEDVSDAPNDDDPNSDADDHEHHHDLHHHPRQHHVHTNVIIGHVAVDGRIQYRDAHDMLLSVLHAIGFSTRAVRTAAAVAAAVAVSFQSSEERAAASRTVLENAWHGTRSLQQQFARTADTTTTNAGRSDQHTPSESAAEHTPSSSSQSPPGHGASTSQARESPTEPEQSRTAEANASSDNTATAVSEPREAASALLPEDPPSVGDGENLLQTSERAADRLLPVVADLMETAASRIRNAPSVINLEGSNRIESIHRLTEDLGSIGGVVTVATTLISTLLPDPDDLRTSNSGNGHAHGSENSRQGGGSANENEATHSNVQDETTNPSTREEQQQSHTEDVGSNSASGASRTRSGPNDNTGSRVESRSFNLFPFGPPSEQNQGERSEGQPRSNRRVRRSRRVRVSSSQAANADFMIRVLSYYFCSISDVQAPQASGPPDVEGQTAVSVLDGLYGRNNTARPTNMLLQVAHTAMQKLTPPQFHEILQGNMLPLGAIRREVWEEISRVIRALNNADIEREEVEQVLVDDICEVLHDFVHILESADEANEDGVFTPGPEDFCHQIMHVIQGKVEILVGILSRSRTQQDFAGKMSHWIKNAIGEVLFAVSAELEMQWDGLLNSFRRAVYEIGKTVVGSQFSVIFPYIANLLANRAKSLFEVVASRHPAEQRFGIRETGCANTNGAADHSTSQTDSDLDIDGESYNETDSDMPDLDEADSCDDSSNNSDKEIALPDGERGDPIPKKTAHDADNHVICDLDDAELRDLARELASEVEPTEIGGKHEGSLDEVDFKIMASELIADHGSSFDRSVPSSSSLRTNVPPSSAQRATFSSAAAQRGGSSTPVQKSDFEKILGSRVGSRWERIVDRDEIRVLKRTYGPLSRGYSGTDSTVSTLDTKRGAELATEAAREAAKRAKLSPERAKELERVASESGPQYMKEVEKAIKCRLLSDHDFDRQSFPRAAKRFLPNETSA